MAKFTPDWLTNTHRRIDLAIEGLWLTILALTPVLFVPTDAGAWTQVPKVALVRAGAGLIVMLLAVDWALTPRQDRFTLAKIQLWPSGHPARWILLAALAFFATHLLSTITSSIWTVSVWGSTPGMDGYPLYTVAAFAVVFFAIAQKIRRRPQVRRLIGIIVGTGFAVGLVAVAQRFGFDPFNLGYSGNRVQSTLGNPIYAAHLLTVTTLVSFGAAAANALSVRSRWMVGLWWVPLAVQVSGLIFTLSRGPWVGFAVGLMVALAGIVAAREGQWKRLVSVYVPVAVLVVLLLLVPLGQEREDTYGDGARSPLTAATARAASIATSATTDGLTGRLWVWQASLRVFAERPWFNDETDTLAPVRQLVGYGPEVFRYVLPLRSPPELSVRFPGTFGYAHNHYIHLLVENGLLGLSAFLCLMFTVLVPGVRNLWKMSGGEDWWLALGIQAALVGWLVAALTAIPRISDLIVIWALLGLVVALRVMPTPIPSVSLDAIDDASSKPPRSRAKKTSEAKSAGSGLNGTAAALAVIVIMLVGGLSWSKTVPYLFATAAADNAVRELDLGDMEAARVEAERAIDWAPDVSYYKAIRGRVFEISAVNTEPGIKRNQLLAEALSDYHSARMMNPYSPRETYLLAVGSMNAKGPDRKARWDDGLALMERLRDGAPNDYRPRDLLGHHYWLDGQLADAMAELDNAIRLAGETQAASHSYLVKSFVLFDLGHVEEAVQTAERALELGIPNPVDKAEAYRFLARAYLTLNDEVRGNAMLDQYQAVRSEAY